jgi:hypothetical protein
LLGAVAFVMVGAAAAGNSLRVGMGIAVMVVAWLAVAMVHAARRRVG